MLEFSLGHALGCGLGRGICVLWTYIYLIYSAVAKTLVSRQNRQRPCSDGQVYNVSFCYWPKTVADMGNKDTRIIWFWNCRQVLSLMKEDIFTLIVRFQLAMQLVVFHLLFETFRFLGHLNEFSEILYLIYHKYWDNLSTYHTCPKIWNSPFYYLLMCLKWCVCCMYGEQCRPWSDVA